MTNFQSENIEDISSLFMDFKNLTMLDFSNLKTPLIKYADYLLFNCINLKYFYFGNNFISKNLKSITFMFSQCENLISIDLSKIETIYIEDMTYLFSGCKNLIYLDLSNFITKSCVSMSGLFNNCVSLKTLKMENINTSNVEKMDYMFYYCLTLIHQMLNICFLCLHIVNH